MSLYSYRKAENYLKSKKEYLDLTDEEGEDNKISAWSGAKEGYSFLQYIVNSSFLANLIIPSFFIALGLYFIFQYFYPEIQYQIQKENGLVTQGTTTLISSNYIDRSKYISSPAGMSKVTTQAFSQNILQEDTTSKNYNGTFYISIPSLNINRLPVKSNVDSTTESVYDSVLKNSLAHFENTGLPISEIKNNIVIYGHSASPNYNPQSSDPEVAFSFLPNLKVGDEILIEIEGKIHKFRMFRSKIVEPTDISIITGKENERTLTLFTCYPVGNNANRYVAIARPVN